MIAKGLEDSSIPLEMLVTTQNSKELHLCLNQQQGGADPPSSESSTPREREGGDGREAYLQYFFVHQRNQCDQVV